MLPALDDAARFDDEAVRLAQIDGFVATVPEGYRAQVGERGERLDESVPGSGLGLAIAAEIALRHRSHVELLDGAGGRGLRVRMRFVTPLDDGAQALVDQLAPPWT